MASIPNQLPTLLVRRTVELTDYELVWKDPRTSETRGSVAAEDALSVIGGLTHKGNYGIRFQFRDAKQNGTVTDRFFWSKNLKTIEVRRNTAC